MGGGERVDLLGTAGAADVRLDHRPLHGLCRPALVPEQDRQGERREIARKGADRLRAGTVCAVHAEGKPDDEPGDMLAGRECLQSFQVLCELGPTDGLRRSGEVPAGIADREADRLGSDVEPGELAAFGKRGGEFGGIGGDQQTADDERMRPWVKRA